MSTPASLPSAKFGNGPELPRLGFGLMGLSTFYGKVGTFEERFKILDRSLELGETFWDTADMYGDSEDLVGAYFKKNPSARSKVFLATKFANVIDDETYEMKMTVDSSPEYAKKCIDRSLKRLGVDQIDLYYMHRADGKTPIEKTVETLAGFVKEGKIKYIGLSEVSAKTLRRAHAVHPITAVQLEYSPFAMEAEAKNDERYGVIETCRELGIAVVAYSPLGRGMLTGRYTSVDDFDKDDFRRMLPKYNEENFPKSIALVNEIAELAKKKGCTTSQLTLAWLLAQGKDIFPIPGTKQINYLEENLGGLKVSLSAAEEKEIRQKVNEAEGSELGRYPEMMAAALYADTPELS